MPPPSPLLLFLLLLLYNSNVQIIFSATRHSCCIPVVYSFFSKSGQYNCLCPQIYSLIFCIYFIGIIRHINWYLQSNMLKFSWNICYFFCVLKIFIQYESLVADRPTACFSICLLISYFRFVFVRFRFCSGFCCVVVIARVCMK